MASTRSGCGPITCSTQTATVRSAASSVNSGSTCRVIKFPRAVRGKSAAERRLNLIGRRGRAQHAPQDARCQAHRADKSRQRISRQAEDVTTAMLGVDERLAGFDLELGDLQRRAE